MLYLYINGSACSVCFSITGDHGHLSIYVCLCLKLFKNAMDLSETVMQNTMAIDAMTNLAKWKRLL